MVLATEKGSFFEDKGESLRMLSGASRYTYFHKRVVSKPSDIKNYYQKCDELQNFISLCPWETECLFKYASFAKKGIVEIGRYKGCSTLLLSLANPKTKIISKSDSTLIKFREVK